MHPSVNDLTGKRFGKWVVLERAGSRGNKRSRNACWLCRCDCGKARVVWGSNLVSGSSKSCLDCRPKRCDGDSKGGQFKRLYNIWHNIIERCRNPHIPDYKDYGGRGITLCKEWKESYLAFKTWSLENGYRDDLQIDRINNDGNYCPENCRWVDNKTNVRNRNCTVKVTINGETKPLVEFAEMAGINKRTVSQRYRSGIRGEELLKTSSR